MGVSALPDLSYRNVWLVLTVEVPVVVAMATCSTAWADYADLITGNDADPAPSIDALSSMDGSGSTSG
ncbi:hypothetical protein SAMN04489716_8539 [Actinoplanes derwentensis]|uniref:Uncharacterized protein n=2 Tax=Actinoplanes derwentensis TaxID=113562 RepID=A0A1H2D7Y3_9ACTN|nr:hypothetical protein SAMN04489716_8539 [Actinoplanes derwentensis]